MQRVFVVLGVAGPEAVMIMPTNERKNAERDPVEPSRLEHGQMNQFMEPIDRELPEVAIDENEQRGHIPRPMQ